MDEKRSRIELKRSRECVVDSDDSELEVRNKRLAVESSNVVDSVQVETVDIIECDLETVEVERHDKQPPETESRSDVDSSKVELKCLNECVLDAFEAEIPEKQSGMDSLELESLNDGTSCRVECVLETVEAERHDKESRSNVDSSKVELECLNECVLDTVEAEIPEKQSEMESLDNENSLMAASKCLNECVRDTVEAEIPEKKPDMESFDDESTSMEASKCLNECVRDTVEAEIPEKKPDMESFDDESTSMKASKCLDECVRDTEEAEIPEKQSEMESLDNENSSMVASKCLSECVRDTMEAEIPEKQSEKESLDNENSLMAASECLNECVRDTVEAEIPEEQPEMESLDNKNSLMAASKCLNECVRDTVEAQIPEKQPEMESLDNENSSMAASKGLNECVRDTVEAEIPEKQPEMESLDNENSLMAASTCLNECVRDTVEAEIPDRELAIESLNDENSLKAESKCPKECGLDTVEAEVPDKKPEVGSLNDASSSNPESKCPNECALGNIEAETPDTKLATESLVYENNSSDGPNLCKEDLICLSECLLDASEAVIHDSRTPKELSNEEKNSRADLKRSHEWIVDATEAESPSKKPVTRSSNYEISSKAESKCLSGCLIDASKADSPSNRLANKVINDVSSKTELKCIYECRVDAAGAECLTNTPSIKSPNNFVTVESKLNEGVDISIDATEAVTPNNRPAKESLDNESASGVEPHECGANHRVSECLDNKPTTESSTGDKSSRVEPNCLSECVLDATEVETPNNQTEKDFSDVGNSVSVEERCLYECDIDAIEGETHEKSLAKEFSTESVSEVLNPNVSPHENASSSQTVSSQPVEGLLRSGCRDITSSSAGDSSTEVADKDGTFVNDFPNSLLKSEVISEGSKIGNTRGIRRIVFTFSKGKTTNDGVLPETCHPSCSDGDNGFSYSRRHGEPHMNYSKVKTSRQGMLENYTKNVRKLLSTGVLEGVEVKYINEKKEILRGIIKDCGYLCGCALCNFSKVLNAHEFEQHAGCKTKHPNDHVFLENGISLYSIVQELKRSPASSLEGTIRALVGPFFNEKSYFEWKESLEIEIFQTKEKECQMESHLNLVGFPQSTMSCSSEDTEDNLGSVSRSMMQTFPVKHKSSMLQSISKGGKQVTKSSRSASPSTTVGRTKKRDNDLHRLLFMPNGLPDGAELAYYARGQRVLDGYKQGNGIVCSCCESEISPSQFEAHAGCSAKRQPYRHIYTSNGVSLHEIALSLANGQCLAISNSSEKCTICGDGGDIVLCDACSHGFHAACLELQCIPDEGWCCPYCKDKIGNGRKVSSTESVVSVKPITIRLTRIVKPPVAEVGGCVVCRVPDFSVLKFDERTVILCDQCEKEYHVGCLRKRGLCDLKELPQGKWFCCDPCNRIHATLQHLTFTGAKVIPTSMSNTISRKLIEKGLSCEVGNDVQWKVLSGKFGSLEHRSLLSSAVALFRDSFDPIVERSGRDLIPAMVYGRNVSGQEFGGMYCAVLSVKSVVVSAGLLRIFGLEVAELPLVATAKESQGKGYFQVLFACIEKLLRFLNVEKLVLPAAEDAKSIWTNKFGFKKMTDDKFQKYTRDIQLISFKGTLMLEKTVVSQPK